MRAKVEVFVTTVTSYVFPAQQSLPHSPLGNNLLNWAFSLGICTLALGAVMLLIPAPTSRPSKACPDQLTSSLATLPPGPRFLHLTLHVTYQVLMDHMAHFYTRIYSYQTAPQAMSRRSYPLMSPRCLMQPSPTGVSITIFYMDK